MRWLPVALSPVLWPALMCGALRVGGLVFSPFIGTVVYGALPLAMSACLGDLAGRRLDRALDGSIARRASRA